MTDEEIREGGLGTGIKGSLLIIEFCPIGPEVDLGG